MTMLNVSTSQLPEEDQGAAGDEEDLGAAGDENLPLPEEDQGTASDDTLLLSEEDQGAAGEEEQDTAGDDTLPLSEEDQGAAGDDFEEDEEEEDIGLQSLQSDPSVKDEENNPIRFVLQEPPKIELNKQKSVRLEKEKENADPSPGFRGSTTQEILGQKSLYVDIQPLSEKNFRKALESPVKIVNTSPLILKSPPQQPTMVNMSVDPHDDEEKPRILNSRLIPAGKSKILEEKPKTQSKRKPPAPKNSSKDIFSARELTAAAEENAKSRAKRRSKRLDSESEGSSSDVSTVSQKSKHRFVKKSKLSKNSDDEAKTSGASVKNSAQGRKSLINRSKLNKKNKKGETPLHAACCKV